MKIMRTTFVLLCISSCLSTGCVKHDQQRLSLDAEVCRERISTFRVHVGLDAMLLMREGRKLCDQTLALTNANERIVLLREFVNKFYAVEIDKCSIYETSKLIGEYCRMPKYLAYGLIRAGGTDEEAWQAMIRGLENYKRMCLAHGDEDDLSDGNGADANERRRIVRWAKKTWLGCLEFYEKHSIRPVFGAVSEDAVRRYTERWNKKFGSEQAELRAKYSWPLPPTDLRHDKESPK